jgi:hypothetical protein
VKKRGQKESGIQVWAFVLKKFSVPEVFENRVLRRILDRRGMK